MFGKILGLVSAVGAIVQLILRKKGEDPTWLAELLVVLEELRVYLDMQGEPGLAQKVENVMGKIRR